MSSNVNFTRVNGVSLCHLTFGRSSSEWDALRRTSSIHKLKSNPSYRDRIELLQDFEFPHSCNRLALTNDGHHCIASGVYKPSIKCFSFSDLSQKFDRRTDFEVVDIDILSSNDGKLALLRGDRTIEVHSQFGCHQKVRIPTFGRDLCFIKETADLFVAAEGKEIFRLNLEEGRFKPSLRVEEAGGVNVLTECQPSSPLSPFTLLSGLPTGMVEVFDLRHPLHSVVNFAVGDSITSLSVSPNGLSVGVGTSNGKVLLFDVRSRMPLTVKDHRNSLPIVKIQFASIPSIDLVCSADGKGIKIWNSNDGQPFTTITTDHPTNDFVHIPQSGMFLIGCEQPRIEIFHIPNMGAAPKWASFIDTLTEELAVEEEKKSSFDGFQFVSMSELESFGMVHLIGTSVLRPYLNGYFISHKLYSKMKSLSMSSTNTFDSYLEGEVRRQIDRRRDDRIVIKANAKPKVNVALSNRANIVEDSRFNKMFKEEDFAVDVDNALFTKNFGHRKELSERNEESEDEDEVDDEDEGSEESEYVEESVPPQLVESKSFEFEIRGNGRLKSSPTESNIPLGKRISTNVEGKRERKKDPFAQKEGREKKKMKAHRRFG